MPTNPQRLMRKAHKRAHPVSPAQTLSLVSAVSFGQLVADLCFVGLQMEVAPTEAKREWFAVLVREVSKRSA